jgi:hypothetical protein
VECRRLMWMIGRSTLITVDSEYLIPSGLSTDKTATHLMRSSSGSGRLSRHGLQSERSADLSGSFSKLTISPVYYNSQLVPPEFPLTVSRIYKVPMVLDDSPLKKLEKLLSCLNHILVSTELIYRLTRRTRHLSRN